MSDFFVFVTEFLLIVVHTCYITKLFEMTIKEHFLTIAQTLGYVLALFLAFGNIIQCMYIQVRS